MSRARFAPPIRLIMNKLQSILLFGVIVISYKILILTTKLQKIFQLCNISPHFFFYRLVFLIPHNPSPITLASHSSFPVGLFLSAAFLPQLSVR